jgi:rRNA small subunit pseudouridine methyltransferase Nep1
LLSLVIADAALETVPRSIVKHPSVTRDAARKDMHAEHMLLDRSYHHAAMLKLKDASRRGRPDLVHFALLEATSTPLYVKNMLRVYVHTITDSVIIIHENVRLPKSYFRFEGVMEELFKSKNVQFDGKMLMELKGISFPDLIGRIKPELVVGLSRLGVKSSAEEVARIAGNDSLLVVGGFPRGHFSPAVSREIDHMHSINEQSLEAHVVIARILYECEKVLEKK